MNFTSPSLSPSIPHVRDHNVHVSSL
jgi:hypothetical protein